MVRQHKRRRTTRRERQSRDRGLYLAVAMLLMLGSVTAQRIADFRGSGRQAKALTPLTPIRYEAKQTTPQEQPALSVFVNVNAQETSAPDLPALAEALHGIAEIPNRVSSAAPGETAASAPAWVAWAHLNTKSAPVQINAPATVGQEGLRAYAVSGEWGTSLCLVNKTSNRLLTTAQFRLPRGVYTLERLTLRPGGEDKETRRQGDKESQSPIANRQSAIETPLNPQPSTTLSHLEGCDFGAAGTVRKVFCLEPGQACLYRCLDSAREARAAWYDVFTQLHGMAARQPGQANRLRVMLREANSYLAGVTGGGKSKGWDARLECIHHLLLITAQAHSLHHNYQMRHTVEENAGKDVMGAMDRLTNALSETSAVLLGLVPQVSVTSTSLPGAHVRTAAALREQNEIPAENKKEIPGVTPNMQTRDDRTVVVSLENTGGRSIRNVKLGLNMAGMPGGSICEPADPAYFDALRPGQSVRAIFHVRCGANTDLPNTLFTGDVSYFAGTAPAHLRPHAW